MDDEVKLSTRTHAQTVIFLLICDDVVEAVIQQADLENYDVRLETAPSNTGI